MALTRLPAYLGLNTGIPEILLVWKLDLGWQFRTWSILVPRWGCAGHPYGSLSTLSLL